MAKFVIECPSCGRYTEASGGILGFFADKTIPCSCGYTIHVKTDKVASRKCEKCGNDVIYDQSKGENALCPVCGEQIGKRENMFSLVEFSCPSCSCRLSADKATIDYICPLCETSINVPNQIQKEKIKNQGLASVIKYEGGNDTFVWKHPIEDFNLGSQLIVHESQEAIFFRDGKALDLFGAGRYTLATQNLPLLENLYKLPSNSQEVFHSEIYFINMATQMGIKWGTDSKVRLFDPASGLHIEIGAHGSFNLRVNNSRKLVLKIVGTERQLTQDEVNKDSDGGTKYMIGKFRSLIMSKVKATLAKSIRELQINILEIDSYIDELSERLKTIINETLDDYGLVMPEFFITGIATPDDDPNYRRLRQQFADKTLLVRQEEVRKAEAQAAQERKIVEAQTEAGIRLVGARTEAEAIKLKAEAEAIGYQMQAMAEAEGMRAKGYTYQQETSRQIGLEAMKNGLTGGGTVGDGTAAGGAGLFGNIAELGVTLGAMGGVINMAKEALDPLMEGTREVGASFGSTLSPPASGGEIPPAAEAQQAGDSNPQGNAAGQAGAQSPQGNAAGQTGAQSSPTGAAGQTDAQSPQDSAAGQAGAQSWDCTCGTKGIASKFCPNCGSKRPETAEQAAWDCTCGTKGITSKFCPNCGAKKPEQGKEEKGNENPVEQKAKIHNGCICHYALSV